MTSKVFVQSIIKPMPVKLKNFHHNKIIQEQVMQIKPKERLILVMNHRTSKNCQKPAWMGCKPNSPYRY